jgi:sugar/nucleoside kinase (ribokinase family)
MVEDELLVDTVGAGDAFAAVLAAGVLRNGISNRTGLQATLQAACSAGAAAVSSKGAHVVFSPECAGRFHLGCGPL